jgi:hypothetical protein
VKPLKGFTLPTGIKRAKSASFYHGSVQISVSLGSNCSPARRARKPFADRLLMHTERYQGIGAKFALSRLPGTRSSVRNRLPAPIKVSSNSRLFLESQNAVHLRVAPTVGSLYLKSATRVRSSAMIAASLADMAVTGEHRLRDVAGQRHDRLLRDRRILGQPRDERAQQGGLLWRAKVPIDRGTGLWTWWQAIALQPSFTRLPNWASLICC